MEIGIVRQMEMGSEPQEEPAIQVPFIELF
jgi:hypothetical protein